VLRGISFVASSRHCGRKSGRPNFPSRVFTSAPTAALTPD
jgi:hypothetical protein